MAARTFRHEEIDFQLRIVTFALIDLQSISLEWAEMSMGIKMGWEQEWRDYMHRFESLHRAYRAGGMNDDQQAQFLALQRDLEASAPLIQSLELQSPPVLSET